MAKVRLLTAVDASGSSFQVATRVSDDDGWFRLELDAPELGTRAAEASDVFECLCRIRVPLDHEGVRLCCNGARRDVWPSGMARDMGGGFRAYVLEIGRRASREDLVDIFDPAPIESIATVDEQRRFSEKWLATARR